MLLRNHKVISNNLKEEIILIVQGLKKHIVQHWNFACPIFQDDKALNEIITSVPD